MNLDIMRREYREFQCQRRQENGEIHGLSIFELGPPGSQPFISFRHQLELSQMAFAKLFCIHPGLLYRVERGISQTLPSQLAVALKEAGLSDAVLQDLRFRIEEVV